MTRGADVSGEMLKREMAAAAARGEELMLGTDLRLWASTGWLE